MKYSYCAEIFPRLTSRMLNRHTIIAAILIFLLTPALCDDLQSLYNQYSQTTLLSDRYFEIKGLTIEEEALKVTFEDGKLFLTDHICDGYRGAVFIGEGAFSVKVPEVWEQVVTNRLKADVYPLTECGFEAAFFLMPPEYLGMHDFFSSGELILREADEVVVVNEESAKIKAALIEKAENILYSRIGPSDQTRLPVISFLKNHYNETPKLKPLLFDFETGRFGWLSYEFHPEEKESIKIVSVEKKALIDYEFWNSRLIASFNGSNDQMEKKDFNILKQNVELFIDNSPDEPVEIEDEIEIKPYKNGLRFLVLNLRKNFKGFESIKVSNIMNGNGQHLVYMHNWFRGIILVDIGEETKSDRNETLEIYYSADLFETRGDYVPCTCCEQRVDKWIKRGGSHPFPKAGELYGEKYCDWLPFICRSDRFDTFATIKIKRDNLNEDKHRIKPASTSYLTLLNSDKQYDTYRLSDRDANDPPRMYIGRYSTFDSNDSCTSLEGADVNVFTLPAQMKNIKKIRTETENFIKVIKGNSILKNLPIPDFLNIIQGPFISQEFTDAAMKNNIDFPAGFRSTGIFLPGEAFLSSFWPGINSDWFLFGRKSMHFYRSSEGSKVDQFNSFIPCGYIESQVMSHFLPESYNDEWLPQALSGYLFGKYLHDDDPEVQKMTYQKWSGVSNSLNKNEDLPLHLAGIETDRRIRDVLLYCKGTMVLNMIDTIVGEGIMMNAVREFFNKHQDMQFSYSSFFDILYEKVDQSITVMKNSDKKKYSTTLAKLETFRDMKHDFLKDWIMRSGNTEMKIAKEVIPQGKRHQLLLRISQDEESFKHMIVPVNIYKNSKKKVTLHVLLDKPDKVFEAEFPWKPKKIIIDENNTLPTKISTTEWE